MLKKQSRRRQHRESCAFCPGFRKRWPQSQGQDTAIPVPFRSSGKADCNVPTEGRHVSKGMWPLACTSSLPRLQTGTEPRGVAGPTEETCAGGLRTERPRPPTRPPFYLRSGLPPPVSGLCPLEQGVIIQLPPGASGPLSAEKFSLRLGPLALCHLWAEDMGRAEVTCWGRSRALAKDIAGHSSRKQLFKNLLRDLIGQEGGKRNTFEHRNSWKNSKNQRLKTTLHPLSRGEQEPSTPHSLWSPSRQH